MRNPLLTLLLTFCLAAPLQAADDAPVEPFEKQPVQLGGGVVLPREAFDQIIARDDGMAMIERMQHRAEDARRYDGMPYLILIFCAVLLFFWSSMFYYQRKHARLHRTILLMIEKGLPLPPEILRAAEQAEAGGERPLTANAGGSIAPVWASNLLWGGLLWVTIGIAGTLYLWLRGNDAWPWGIAALVYGLAAVATALKNRKAR
jgi:hypothetical protein